MFVAKTVLGASAVKFLKGTTKFQKIATKFSNTKVGAVVSKIKSPVDAAKARLGAKLADGASAASSEIILAGKTAVSRLRISRITGVVESRYLDDLAPEARDSFATSVARTGNKGKRILADGGGDVVAVFKRFDSVDAETAERLADLRKSGTLDTRDLDRLEDAVENGPMTGDELRQVSRVLKEEGELRYDDDVDVEDIVDLAEKRDLSTTRMVISPDESINKNGYSVDTVRLDIGDENTGSVHLYLRHVAGKEREKSDVTSFWPVGQQVGSRNLPDALEINDIERVVYEAVKNGRVSDNGVSVVYTYDNVDVKGISEITVKVDEETGRVITAFPSAGSKVDTYYGEADAWNLKKS